MDIQLYVYDLSRGLARAMSQQFLGTQIDAVYHTSLVFDGIEYMFGQGIQTAAAGTTHHGKPMEIIPMGSTDLPMEIILEYMESLKEVYSAESYDLFLHNCNNFTNDFAMFLVGKGIPDHITSLPQTVLDTPFGQMLKPQLDAMMRPITQAPMPQPAPPRPYETVGSQHNAHIKNIPPQSQASSASTSDPSIAIATGKVNNETTLRSVERLLDLAKDRCAIIFFTSATCGPCKLVYQPYDDLAAETGDKCVFIKIDFAYAERAINGKFPHVRATPTFMTFLKGQKRDEWSGADPRLLRNNVELLLNAAYPPHPHLSKSVPTLLKQSQRPITYAKVPPLEKVVAKMGPTGKDPAVASIVAFIDARERFGAMEAPLTKLPAFAEFLRKSTTTLPPDLLFTALDLLRITLTDVRVSGFFAEEHKGATGTPATVAHLLSHVNGLGSSAPYALRLTTLHLACNLFTSPLFIPHLLSPPLSSSLVSILTTALLDDKHPALKTSALSLAMNIASSNHKIRMKKYTKTAASALPNESELDDSEQVELLASLLEIIGLDEPYCQTTQMALICVGWLIYGADIEGELKDLWKVMGAADSVGNLKGKTVDDRFLVKEVKALLEA
ncbi:PPPDE putative peptidase domain-containing protein [Lophiotrema nucula]|uniref:PPPDE putative peptidase domain-containing protein n=1 Tax=Lophiotrema nucula TaxID=690887 RepID=A0A6A5Z0R2_9PLEO|nr:PPPDE putative peptidase domain-containing protein [Lophiotrema nucula]